MRTSTESWQVSQRVRESWSVAETASYCFESLKRRKVTDESWGSAMMYQGTWFS